MSRQTKLGTLAAILGNGIFGFSFMFSSIALKAARPFVMLMYRFGLAFIALNGVALWSARWKVRSGDDAEIHWLRFRLNPRALLPLLLMGLIQPVAYFLCESYGIRLTNATLSGVIIALIPIAALAGGWIALGEKPRRSQVLFSMVSILGVALMTFQQDSQSEIHYEGVLLLIGAVITGMSFNIISRKLSDSYSALERTYVMMMVGAIAFTALAVAQCGNHPEQLIEPLKSPGFRASVLYLGLISSIVAFMCLNYANNYLPVAKTTAFCNLSTVVSLFAGAVFLREPFGIVSLIAALMILLGIWGVQRSR